MKCAMTKDHSNIFFIYIKHCFFVLPRKLSLLNVGYLNYAENSSAKTLTCEIYCELCDRSLKLVLILLLLSEENVWYL